MNIRVPAFGLSLALGFLLSTSGTGLAQVAPRRPMWGPQDTTQAWPWAPRWRGRGFGPGLGLRAFMDPDHVGPAMLVRLRSFLELSDDQVERLGQIRDDHYAAIRTLGDELAEVRQSIVKARAERDWDGLEAAIDEFSRLSAEGAKSGLEVERQSLGVLSDEQREKLDVWQEGVGLYGRGRMGRWQDFRGRRPWGRGRGWRRWPVPPPPPED
jgi:hypothetical protein